MTQFDVTTATYVGSLDISAQESTFPNLMTFSSDGTRIFMCSALAGGNLYEYSTVGFDVVGASFVTTHSFPSAKDIKFTADGLKLFILTGNFVHRYDMSTPYNIASRVFHSQKNMNTSSAPDGGDSFMQGFWISADGLQVWTVGYGNSAPFQNPKSSDRVYKWIASTAFDMSTLSLSSHYHTTENFPTGIHVKEDGTRYWVTGAEFQPSNTARSIHQFNMSPPFNVIPSSAQILDISSQVPEAFSDPLTFYRKPVGLYFNPTGQRLFYVDQQTQEFDEWTMQAFGLTKTFTINAILKKIFETADVNARLIKRTDTGGALKVGARLVWFCDTINTNTGWVTTNGGGQILIDDPSFPDVIHCVTLSGGGGATERWISKNIGRNISGDVKFEFSYDFQAMNGSTTSTMSIFLSEQNIHDANNTGSKIGCYLADTRDDTHHLYGYVTDGISTKSTIQGGAFNQKTTCIYPPNQPGGVDPELLGIRYITVELKNNKLRISHFKDSSKTIHARGSPREVDATGITPINLRYIVISNSKGSGSARQFTGDIDDIYVTQNEPLPPLAVNTTTQTLVEDWEVYGIGEENPSTWLSGSELLSNNGGTFDPFSIDIHEVSTEQPNGGIKSFKLHIKYQHTGAPTLSGTTESSSGIIGKKVLTPANPDGGQLLVPYKYFVHTLADLLSTKIDTIGAQLGIKAGIAFAFEVLGGAPNVNVGAPLQFGSRVLYYGPFADESGVRIWTGTTSIPANRATPDLQLPSSIYQKVEGNIANNFNQIFNQNGLDFESHVKSVQIGYFIYNSAGGLTAGNVEGRLYGDEINLVPENIKQKDTKINAIVKSFGNDKTFIINAKLVLAPGMVQLEPKVNALLKAVGGVTIGFLPATFTVRAHIGDPIGVPSGAQFSETHILDITPVVAEAGTDIKTFTVKAKVVKRTAVNNLTPSAVLKAFGTNKTFIINSLLIKNDTILTTKISAFLVGSSVFTFVNAILKAVDEEEIFTINGIIVNPFIVTSIIDALLSGTQAPTNFSINALLVNIKQITTFIDAQITPIKTLIFTVDGEIGTVSEPQSILNVESVIGHKTGLQS